MSGGAKGGPSRVSIPSGVKKTIDNIKEIIGQNHSEDEIYAMLKECSMDPNETTQKLLSLDTFHEVRRKRDRKKENLNKDPAELKWKPGAQAKPNRTGRGNYPSRYVSHDTSGGRNSAAVKENATSHLIEKNVSKGHLVTSQDSRKNGTSSVTSQVTAVANGPSAINQTGTTANFSSLEGPLLPPSRDNPIKNLDALATKDIQQNRILESSNSAASISIPSAPTPGSCFSSSDPVLLPSPDTPLPSAVGTIQCLVGSRQATPELIDDNPTESKSESVKVSTSEVGTPTLKQKTQNDFPGVEKSQHDPLQAASSVGSRPPSNYNNRSQAIGSQKVIPSKEWKPKSANANAVQSATTLGSRPESQTTSVVLSSKEATIELQKKLENSYISDGKHVIIPNHLYVPDVEKLGFCFGSFNASFGLDMSQNGVLGSDKSPAMSESSETINEPLKEPQTSNLNVSVPAEDAELKFDEHPQSPTQEPENLSSSESEVSSPIIPDYGESKPEVPPGSHQHQVVHTSSNYNIGFMPPILGSQLTPLEGSESQARDASRLPGIFVQQSFDPASYYTQFYRSGLDSDGRISPFHPAGATNKYNGNAAVVSAQTSQTPQEGGIPLVASPTLMTQAAGVMQSSISPAQQPPPVFRQPAGVHLPHYPPNYIPYGPYFSPYYVPPPAIHQFMGNGAFPQQPQAGSLYPSAPGTNAKYSVSQYKQGSNTGTATHVELPGNYGPYGLPVANYASGSATTAVTSTSNEENPNPHIKENNIYGGGQQNDSSGVWFTTPMRDISTLQASSFYNLPQGQLAFAPAQPGHGAFPGIFHPTQAVTAANVHPLLQQSQPITNAIDIVGPTGGVYQPQPQHTQINWPSNY